MPRIQLNETINADHDHVFDVFANLHHAQERLSGVDKIELLSEGPIQSGTRWKETRKMMGKSETIELTIEQFKRPGYYTVIASAHGADYLTEFRFSKKDELTEVQVNFKVLPKSLFAKILSPITGLMMGPVKKSLKQDMLDLKKVCEQA